MASAAIQFLTIPPSREVAEAGFCPTLCDWFRANFGTPTLAQRLAWPTILNGKNFLLASPTGTGKTLAAFLPILQMFHVEHSASSAGAPGIRCLYVAPLKALCRDVYVSLKKTMRSIADSPPPAPESSGVHLPRIGMRTGDTSWRVRQRQFDEPPAILVTTPESLSQILTQPAAKNLFRNLRWIIIDEIHALVGSKRGADLAISMERIAELAHHHPHSPQRIGLSATCTPLETVAEFLVGVNRPCTVASVSDTTEKHFAIEPLFENLDYSPAWMATLLDRLDSELAANRTTLIFTNTRNLAERLTWALRRRYPERCDEIGVHHSALSAARRRMVERRLKHGRLWAAVSSTSLELGIDIGSVDLVVFIHPPGAVVRLLQRVGRSGHRPGERRRGLLLTASPSELLESVVTAGSGRDGQIEPVKMAHAPLDVLCQQIAGAAMADWTSPRSIFDTICRAAPYRCLKWSDFQDCLDYLSGRRRDGVEWLPSRLRWEGDSFAIADARTAKLLRRNLGTIFSEEVCTIRLREPSESIDAPAKTLGEVDQIYAERLQIGDRFVLDGRSVEIKKRESAGLIVEEAFGRPQIPRWLGAGAPMPGELARRIFLFRAHAGELLRDGEEILGAWLRDEYQLEGFAAESLINYLQSQETISEIPTLGSMTIESVAMQSCTEHFVHTPLPRATNETLVRVLLHRWNRVQKKQSLALASDLGIYLLTFDSRPPTANDWRSTFKTAGFLQDFDDHLRTGDLLQNYFGRVVHTGLMVLRHPAGRQRKVGGRDWSERRLFEQVRQHCPDFVLLRQAEHDIKASACDPAGALAFLELLQRMPIRIRQLAEPSPFGESLLSGARPSGVNSQESLEPASLR